MAIPLFPASLPPMQPTPAMAQAPQPIGATNLFSGAPRTIPAAAPAQQGLGGLNPAMNPHAMALMGLGGGLLSASQPSRVPVGLGQMAGGALQGGLGGYAMHDQMQRQAKRDQQMDDLLKHYLGGPAVPSLGAIPQPLLAGGSPLMAPR